MSDDDLQLSWWDRFRVTFGSPLLVLAAGWAVGLFALAQCSDPEPALDDDRYPDCWENPQPLASPECY